VLEYDLSLALILRIT